MMTETLGVKAGGTGLDLRPWNQQLGVDDQIDVQG
jgi:hypothetical protein